MNKKSSISIGPGASSLLLIFVVLAMSVLGMLSLMNSRNDLQLSKRSAEVIEAIYNLNVQAEQSRARADETLSRLTGEADSMESYLEAVKKELSDTMALENDCLSWDETDGTHTIHCSLKILPLNSSARTAWVNHLLVSRTAEIPEDQEWERDWRDWPEDSEDIWEEVIDND